MVLWYSTGMVFYDYSQLEAGGCVLTNQQVITIECPQFLIELETLALHCLHKLITILLQGSFQQDIVGPVSILY